VRDHPVGLDVQSDVSADLAWTRVFLGRGAREIDRVRAGLIRLDLPSRRSTHGYSFCRIPVTARARTEPVGAARTQARGFRLATARRPRCGHLSLVASNVGGTLSMGRQLGAHVVVLACAAEAGWGEVGGRRGID
jgi:hypothetical protein